MSGEGGADLESDMSIVRLWMRYLGGPGQCFKINRTWVGKPKWNICLNEKLWFYTQSLKQIIQETGLISCKSNLISGGRSITWVEVLQC